MTTGATPMEAAERLAKAMRSIAGKKIPIRFPDDETAMLFAVIVENAGTCARALLDRRASGTEAALRTIAYLNSPESGSSMAETMRAIALDGLRGTAETSAEIEVRRLQRELRGFLEIRPEGHNEIEVIDFIHRCVRTALSPHAKEESNAKG